MASTIYAPFPRNYGLLSRTYGLLSRNYRIRSWNFGLLSRTYGFFSKRHGLLHGIVAFLGGYWLLGFPAGSAARKPAGLKLPIGTGDGRNRASPHK